MIEPTSNRAQNIATGEVSDTRAAAAASWRRELAGPAVLVAFYVTVMLLVPPRGEFPTGDDWDYFATVADLMRYGEIRLSDWPAMTLVGQIYWGGLFAKLFGLSYMTLRLSVLSLSLIGTLALYAWAREIGRDRIESLFLGLLYSTCPLVFTLSYSFMTDVPATSLMLLCLLIQAHCVRHGRTALYALAGITASAAYLIRQTAALPALVLAVSLIPTAIRNSLQRRALLALTLPLAVTVASHRIWLDRIHGRPYQAAIGRFPLEETLIGLQYWVNLRPALVDLLQQLVVLGIYLSPLILCLAGRRAQRIVWTSKFAYLVAIVALLGVPTAFVLLSSTLVRFPPRVSIYVNDFYLGFETVSGFLTLKYPLIPLPSFSVGSLSMGPVSVLGLVSLSVLAAFGFAVLRLHWPYRRQAERHRLPFSAPVQAGLCALGLFGLLMMQPNKFDRYLLPIIPLAAMFLISLIPRSQRLLHSGVCWALLTVCAVFSVVGTQDYLVRGRTRLQAVQYLLDSGIRAEDVNAGFEHVGLYLFSPVYRQEARVRPFLLDLADAERVRRLKREDPTTVWRRRREFELRYDQVKDRQPFAIFPYRSWLRAGKVYVYHWPEKGRNSRS
jgi:dolichyl-phosphate-mannose-protein mannosyltransferase